MYPAAAAVALSIYYLSIRIEPHTGGPKVSTIVKNINNVLNEKLPGITVLLKFKVTAEAEVIAIVQSTNLTSISCLTSKILDVSDSIHIDNQPVIRFESLGKNLGLPDNLTQPKDVLLKDNLYLLSFDYTYYGKTTNQFLALWKTQIEELLTARLRGEIYFVSFKHLAEWRTEFFVNKDAVELDFFNTQLPVIQAIGSNVRVESKDVQLLSSYKTC